MSEEKAPKTDVVIRQATPADLPGVAEVFHAAFPESVAHIWGARAPSAALTATLFAVCLQSEPDAFWVAVAGDRVAGYIFAPARLGRVWRTAVTGGWVFGWAGGWLSGRYGLGLRPIRLALANKVSFLRHALTDRHGADARILSIAVHPGFQGRGIAGRLCELALDRLDRLRAGAVRLEVRPGNTPAVRLYTRLGFRRVGSMFDSQGEWWVMIRRP